MKKTVAVLLAMMMTLSVAACGKKDDDSKSKKKDKKQTEEVDDDDDDDDDKKNKKGKKDKNEPSATISLSAENITSDDELVITVHTENLSLEQSAWVGIVPNGTYNNEYEADEADLWFAFIENEDSVFMIVPGQYLTGSGDYLVIVTDSDDNEKGGILETEYFHFDATEANLGDDFSQYDQGMWEQYYQDQGSVMICPFYIGDTTFYWPAGYDGAPVTLFDWADTPCNWAGWHEANGFLVNNDETMRVTNESFRQSFCSCCSYELQDYDPNDCSAKYVLYDGQYAFDAFMDLVERTGGFQIRYVNGDESIWYTVGGKDYTFWYIQSDESDTYMSVATFDPDTWTWTSDEQWINSGAETQEAVSAADNPWECMDRILELAYRDQYHIVTEEIVSIEDTVINGREGICYTHANGLYVAVVDGEFGVALQHINYTDESYFCLYTEILTGDDVNVPDFIV